MSTLMADPPSSTVVRMHSPRDGGLAVVGRDDALLEDEAAVETALSGLNDAIGSLGEIVEGEALDPAHRRGAALGGVDLGLNLGLDRRHLVLAAHDFQAQRRLLDE